MKCCDMHAGKLRYLIFIERRTQVPDGVGGFTEVWKRDPFSGVYASFDDERNRILGMKPVVAGRLQPMRDAVATIRFRGDSNGAPYYSAATDRVYFRGRYYDVTAAFDPDFQQRWIQLDLVEGKPS